MGMTEAFGSEKFCTFFAPNVNKQKLKFLKYA